MRTFNISSGQGDVIFRRADKLPDGLSVVEPKNGRVVITHSETGHDHVMLLDKEQTPSVELYETDNPLIAWIKVNRPTVLEHLKSYDVHESILFNPGIYEIRRQREYTPEGFRRVQD